MNATPEKRTRWFRRLLIVVVAICAAAIVLVVVVDLRAKGSVRHELELWRESGDPLLALEQLPSAERESDPFLDGLERLAAADVDVYEEWPAPEAWTSLNECALVSSAAGFDPWELQYPCIEALQDPRRARELDGCCRAAFLAACASVTSIAPLLREVVDLAAVDGEALLRGDVALEDLVEALPSRTLLSASRCARAAFRGALVADDFAAATEWLRVEFALARRTRTLPSVIGFDAWCVVAHSAEDSLVELLQVLPAGDDLGWFDAELAANDVHAELARALREERLLGHRTFERVLDASSGMRDAVRARVVAMDHAAYLALMRRVIGCVESGDWSDMPGPPPVPDLPWPVSKFPFVSTFITPNLEGQLMLADRRVAQTLLTRAALMQYRDGTEAARAWLAGETDPFDGAPLRSRVDPDGVLVLWSIGTDCEDDHGAWPTGPDGEPEPDIVVLLPAR